MVRFNFVTILSISFCAIAVAGASIRNLELQARSAELAELVEARDLAYEEFEAREYELRERAQELQSRGYDTGEILIFARLDEAALKAKVRTWLTNAQGEAQYGEKKYVKMHSGGTSTSPHCRPWGMKSTLLDEKPDPKKKGKMIKTEVIVYYAKLECAPNDKRPDDKIWIVDQTKVGEGPGTAPDGRAVYQELLKKLI